MGDKIKKIISKTLDLIKAKKRKLTKERMLKLGFSLVMVTLGCAISAFSTIGILIPNGLSSGGLTGIVRVLESFINADFSTMFYIGALIIFVICWVALGFKEARKILLLTIMYPALLVVFQKTNILLLEEKDTILAAIYSGVISGIGAGIVYGQGFSFGGTDVIAKIIKKKLFPFVSLSQVLLVIDGIVIIMSGFVFGRNIALYALVTQVIFSKTVDVIMFGFDSKLVQLEIITNKHDDISEYILEEIGRGVSNIVITGVYTGEQKNKIVTICSPRESMLIKTHIAGVDKNAFVSVIHVDSVWGRGAGFGSLSDKE